MLPILFKKSKSLVVSKSSAIRLNFTVFKITARVVAYLIHKSLNLQIAVKSELRANFFVLISWPHHPILMFRLFWRYRVNHFIFVVLVSSALEISTVRAKVHDSGSDAPIRIYFKRNKVSSVRVRREHRLFRLLKQLGTGKSYIAQKFSHALLIVANELFDATFKIMRDLIYFCRDGCGCGFC